jgi:CubicO group peptidase (beta-lactamase class C family)
MTTTRRDFIKTSTAATLIAIHNPSFGEADGSASLKSQIRGAADALRFPGFVAGVVRDGRLVHMQAEGFADIEGKISMQRDNIFNVASLTKTLTAVMMMQFQREKRLNIDDYVLDYPFLSVGFSSDRLPDANTRLKHVLSHTSEGTPGDNFVYSGSRYNFLYGAFESMSGNKQHYQAVSQELSRRILQPLEMQGTAGGYPGEADKARHAKLVTPYLLDSSHKVPVRDEAMAGNSSTLFPATNVFTCLDDLVKYTTALDENVLIPAEYYNLMTTPFVLNGGSRSPYALGWSSQMVSNLKVHWHYGWGDSYSALIVRVPEKKASFVLLVNSSGASAPFTLQYGNVLASPFAVAFLNTLVPKSAPAAHHTADPAPNLVTGILPESPLFLDAVLSEALLSQYVETAFGTPAGQANALLRYLVKAAPERCRRANWTLLGALVSTKEKGFSGAVGAMSLAYRESGLFHPDVSFGIADYYGGIGEREQSAEWLRDMVQRGGYGEEGTMRRACVERASQLLRSGQLSEGRQLLWKAAQYGRTTESESYQQGLISRMKP